MNETQQHLNQMRRESVIIDLLVTVIRNQHYGFALPRREKEEQNSTLMRAAVEGQSLEEEIKEMLKRL